jgi:hypothetical protein
MPTPPKDPRDLHLTLWLDSVAPGMTPYLRQVVHVTKKKALLVLVGPRRVSVEPISVPIRDLYSPHSRYLFVGKEFKWMGDPDYGFFQYLGAIYEVIRFLDVGVTLRIVVPIVEGGTELTFPWNMLLSDVTPMTGYEARLAISEAQREMDHLRRLGEDMLTRSEELQTVVDSLESGPAPASRWKRLGVESGHDDDGPHLVQARPDTNR